MRTEEHNYLDQLEDRMWWFKGLRRNVEIILSHHVSGHFLLLDAGCGTGGMMHRLEERFPDATLHGIDYSADACERSRRKSKAIVQCGSVSSLPYEDKLFDVITSLDVLGHDAVDMVCTLQEFQRCLKAGGLLLLNVPAYQWMLSYHDLAVGHTMRFTLRGMEHELPKYGFKMIYSTYWNTLFFPLMVLRRKLLVRPDGGSDVKPFPPLIEGIFMRAMQIEQAIISKGWKLPFGGSILILAERVA